MSIKIQICGPSGVGKSTLALFIAHSLDIPFVTTSTKPLWDKHGIKSHKELIDKGQSDPKWGLNFQYEVLKYRESVITDSIVANPKGYVTDRSPIDNLAYFLMQNTMQLPEDASNSYRMACEDALRDQANKIIRIRFNYDQKLEDDGKRINNRFYQMMTDGVFESIFQNDLLNISHHFDNRDLLVINEWDITKRLAEVQDFLNIPNLRKSKVRRWLERRK